MVNKLIPFTNKIQSAWLLVDEFLASRLRKAGIWWAGVVALSVLDVYFIVQLALPGLVSPGSYLTLWQPLLWSGLALLAGLGWQYGLDHRPRADGLTWMAPVIAFFQVAVLMLAGLLQGFGRSPFDHSLAGMLGNLWYLSTLLIGMELSRAYLMAVLGKYAPGISLAVITLLFTLLSIPLGTFLKFDSPRSAIEVSGTLLLPSLAENLLASLLAFGGGPLVSILYRGVLMGVKWFFPILPNLDWFITALLGTLTPAIGMLMVHNHLQARSAQADAQAGAEVKAEGFNLAWAFVAVIGLLLVGFNTGLFGVQPTLIASNSMSPKFWVGDIVVTQKTAPADIQIGDVIRYRDGSRSIVHRVVEVQRSGGMSVFITRGDANDADDPPVVEQALQGKVVMVIPKLGWVSIFIRRLLAGSSG